MPILQKIFLIKAKIYLANCDYLNAYKYIKIITDLCIGQLIYIVDHRSSLENIDTNDNNMTNIGDLSKNKIKTLQTVLMNVILNFYYRGVLSELLGCTAEAIDSYKQSKFFSSTPGNSAVTVTESLVSAICKCGSHSYPASAEAPELSK